eukprot:INCI18081.2.p3 GENE.INCI18081.2~~INCI18081.2.p3  ORF type:complete len:108 (+),score=10.06 INCI18081.2:492-815(+)
MPPCETHTPAAVRTRAVLCFYGCLFCYDSEQAQCNFFRGESGFLFVFFQRENRSDWRLPRSSTTSTFLDIFNSTGTLPATTPIRPPLPSLHCVANDDYLLLSPNDRH